MTWDHPRAWRALEAFAATGAAPAVRWDKQSLAAFEAHPIGDLAQRYDVMVIDHPGLADALEALAPLDDLVGRDVLAAWTGGAVGPSGESYVVDGRTWAVPVDAAAQVAVRRADAGVPVARRWEDVPAIAADHLVTLCLAGPHAGLTLLAMCSTRPPVDPTLLVDPAAAVEALELLRWVHAVADPELSRLDPIGVHEGLAAGGGATWCPLVYGYVSYRDRLCWSDAPSWRGDRPLSVLGGTGLAVSARAVGKPEVLSWLSAYLDEAVQTRLVPAAGGQPAHRAVWSGADPFYAETRRTLEQAWVRPRVRGWIPLQEEISEVARDVVLGRREAGRAVDIINRAWTTLHSKEPT